MTCFWIAVLTLSAAGLRPATEISGNRGRAYASSVRALVLFVGMRSVLKALRFAHANDRGHFAADSPLRAGSTPLTRAGLQSRCEDSRSPSVASTSSAAAFTSSSGVSSTSGARGRS